MGSLAEQWGTSERFDGCVVACPLPNSADICESRDDVRRLAKEVEYGPTVNVIIGSSIPPRTPAFLVLLPSDEEPEVAGIVVESSKIADRAPDGHGLFVVTWEMEAVRRWIDRSDEEIVLRALETAYRVFPEIRDGVELTHVQRWPVALPIARPGVYRAIGEFTDALDPDSPIQFAGDWLSQTSQNTAVAWGRRAAQRLIVQQTDHGERRPQP